MSTKVATDAGTTKSRFDPYQYQVERNSKGEWRALYREYENSSWKAVEWGFDFGPYERTYFFKNSAIKACKKHAEQRRMKFEYKNEPPTYLGEM